MPVASPTAGNSSVESDLGPSSSTTSLTGRSSVAGDAVGRGWDLETAWSGSTVDGSRPEEVPARRVGAAAGEAGTAALAASRVAGDPAAQG